MANLSPRTDTQGPQPRLDVLGKSVLLDNPFGQLGDKVLSSKTASVLFAPWKALELAYQVALTWMYQVRSRTPHSQVTTPK